MTKDDENIADAAKANMEDKGKKEGWMLQRVKPETL